MGAAVTDAPLWGEADAESGAEAAPAVSAAEAASAARRLHAAPLSADALAALAITMSDFEAGLPRCSRRRDAKASPPFPT